MCRGRPLCSHANVSVPDILNLNPENIVKLLLDGFTDITLYLLHTQVFRNHLHKVSVMSLSFIIHSEKRSQCLITEFLKAVTNTTADEQKVAPINLVCR